MTEGTVEGSHRVVSLFNLSMFLVMESPELFLVYVQYTHSL